MKPFALFAAAAIFAFCTSATAAQAENMAFPAGATGVVDVTKPPYNADNSGKTDCTTALVPAYDTVVNKDGYIIPPSKVFVFSGRLFSCFILC